jgi:hypothetical protein
MLKKKTAFEFYHLVNVDYQLKDHFLQLSLY